MRAPTEAGISQEILPLFKPQQPNEKQFQYSQRIENGFELVNKIIQENINNIQALNNLYQTLLKAKNDNPKLVIEGPFSQEWGKIGFIFCRIDSKFSEIFPTIKAEREKWSLLDYLQNEIIQFYHYSGAQSEERLQHAKQAMKFLLDHRDGDITSLTNAVQDAHLEPSILQKFNQAILYYQHKPSIPQPSRGNTKTLDITPGITMKVHSDDSMITVGAKLTGLRKGEYKVKRISSTEGKETEVDKYLNLWLEKELITHAEYTEPAGGAIAQAVSTKGSPKAHLLEKEGDARSSINKFKHNLILAADISNQPNFDSNEQNKLLGCPVVGLIGFLITSSWILQNSDLHDANFGIVPENGKMRFFLFDFDRTEPWEFKKDKLLDSLEAGNISSLKNILKNYIDTDVIGNSDLKILLKKLIDNYDDNSILQELNELISNEGIFSYRNSSSILSEEQANSIHNRLNLLKSSIETCISENQKSFRERYLSIKEEKIEEKDDSINHTYK